MNLSVVFTLVTSFQAVFSASLKPPGGFSRACQGAKTLPQMAKQAEVVTEAVVVKVSAPRDNVYAVTLQVK